MNLQTYLAMFGWIPVVLLLFACIQPRRAVTIAFIIAWLFLPVASFKLAEGVPLFNKVTATCVAVLLGSILFDHHRLLSFRFRWFDLPMAVWCICPFFSSLSNDLGYYDGCSAVLYQIIDWGVPYFIGRVYYSDLDGMQELAIAIMLGGLLYIPLCLYEIRMSPMLHSKIYGSFQHDFGQTMRYGGWRPTVFMEHGLAVGLWMAMSALIATWLWITGTVQTFMHIKMRWWALALIAVTILCKSTGATILLLGGIGVLAAGRYLKTWVLLAAVLAAPLTYMTMRSVLHWDGRSLVSVAESWVGESRAESLEFRINNEDMLTNKALQRPTFGWGRWGRARVYDDEGRDISVTDGLWIIALGNTGLVGLFSFTAVLILPGILLILKFPIKSWWHPRYAPVVAITAMLSLYMVDNLSNAMINPVFLVAAGGALACLATSKIPGALPLANTESSNSTISYKKLDKPKRRFFRKSARKIAPA